MRTAIGTVVTAALVAMACVTPPPRAAAQTAAGPYPLVVIDGVKRPDIPPRLRYVGPVAAETLTTPSYRIVYRGKMVEDSSTRSLYPTDKDSAMVQTLWAPVSIKHFGEQARYGAVLYYTKKYRDAGGAIIAPGEGDMAVRAASNQNAPAGDVAPRIYNNLFNGISLPPDRKAEAMAIIANTYTQQLELHGPVLLMWPRRIELNTARDADLRALLSTDADRQRFDTRSREGRMPALTADMIAQNMYTNLFRNPATNADTKARALATITTSINDDLSAYRHAPDDFQARLAIRNKRDSALRALLPEDERALFDKVAPRTRDAEIKP